MNRNLYYRKYGLCAIVLSMLICAACAESIEDKFLRLEKEGESHYSARQYSEALAVWKQTLAMRPDDVGILSRIGETYLRLAEISNAEETFRKVVKIKPDAWSAWLELGKIRLISWDVASAQEIFDRFGQHLTRSSAGYIFRGDIRMLKNDLYEAELDYRQALAIDPESQPALGRLAICLLGQEKKGEAEKIYATLAGLKPDNPDTLIQMANFWKLADDIGQAEQQYLKVVELEPEDLGLQMALAEFYVDTEQNAKAMTVLEKILNASPDNKAASQMRVEVLLNQGSMNQAGKALDSLYADYHNDMAIQMLKGKYHLMIREPGIAMIHFKDVVDKEPNFPLGHYCLGLAYLAGGQNQLGFQSLVKALSLDTEFYDAELALADYYYKTKEYDLCLEHAGRIAEKEPENYRSHLIMGNAYLAQGKYQDARGKFRSAQLINPESKSPPYFMAMAAELYGEKDAALMLYRDLLDRYTELADAGMRYANLLIQMGKINEARQYFENAAESQPNNPYLRHILGEIYVASGESEAGEKAYGQAVAIDPQMTFSYLKIAEIMKNKGEVDKQIDVLKTAIENVPGFTDAYMELAGIYRRNNQMDEAIATIRTAVAMDQNDPVLANNLASLYLDAGLEFNKAFELAHDAYEKRPDDPAFADTLGWAYFHKGIYGQAVWYLKEAAGLMAGSSLKNSDIWEKEKAIVHHHLEMALKANEKRDVAE